MREIKFRAWDKRIKKMCHVLAVDFLNRVVSTDVGFGTIDGDIELMQFTGIRDKNGVEIFDGDVVRIPDDWDTFGTNAGESYEVIFKNGAYRLKPKYNHRAGGFLCTDEDMALVKIIGNIYENQELLESAK